MLQLIFAATSKCRAGGGPGSGGNQTGCLPRVFRNRNQGTAVARELGLLPQISAAKLSDMLKFAQQPGVPTDGLWGPARQTGRFRAASPALPAGRSLEQPKNQKGDSSSAAAGCQRTSQNFWEIHWVPAFAGMTTPLFPSSPRRRESGPPCPVLTRQSIPQRGFKGLV